MKRLLIFLVAITSMAAAQQVGTMHAILATPIDLHDATAGAEFSAKVSAPLTVKDVVFPRGAKLVGHIQAATHGAKGEAPGNAVDIVLEKVVFPDEHEVRVNAIITALAPPPDNQMDPFIGLQRSQEAEVHGMPGDSDTMTDAATSTARDLHRNVETGWKLQDSAVGAVGIDGLNVTWKLDHAPAVTELATKKKKLRLAAGTQMLVRLSVVSGAKH